MVYGNEFISNNKMPMDIQVSAEMSGEIFNLSVGVHRVIKSEKN